MKHTFLRVSFWILEFDNSAMYTPLWGSNFFDFGILELSDSTYILYEKDESSHVINDRI